MGFHGLMRMKGASTVWTPPQEKDNGNGMPVIFFYKDYSVKFWSAEEERPHVHAIGTDAEVKFWLDPDGVHIAEVKGKINNAELNQLLKEIRKHESECLNQWREYFGN